MELIIDQAYMMKTPQNSNSMCLESFQVGEFLQVLDSWHTWTSPESSVPLPLYMTYAVLPAGCSSVSFTTSFHNKLVNGK